MAGLIPQTFIDDLLDRVDIVDVVNSRVPLKKRAKVIKPVALFTRKKAPPLLLPKINNFTTALAVARVAMPLALLWNLIVSIFYPQ